MKPAPLLLLLAACGSVEVPREHYYRFASPEPAPAERPLETVLRVEQVQVAAPLAGDRLLVADGPCRLLPYELHRWAGSLDSLVGEALLTGLTRSRAFARVKGPGDPGRESLVLTGRVLHLEQQTGPAGSVGRVVVDVQLLDSERGVVVFHDELAREVPVTGSEPADVVAALSAGLAGIVADIVERTRVGAAVPGR